MMRLILLLVAAMAMLVGAGCSETDAEIDETTTTTVPTTTASVGATTTAVPGIAPTPQQLVGMWKTGDGYEMLDEDGTYGWAYTQDDAVSDPLDWGEYAVEGGIFTYVTNPEAGACTRIDTSADPPVREGIVGQYEISISKDGNEVFRTLIDDGCGNRTRDVLPSVTRYTDES